MSHSHDDDEKGSGVSRRHALECMVWAGTGVLWTVAGGAQTVAPKHFNAGGMQMINMSENGFSYWVVSDMEWATLDAFVADFRAKSGGGAN